MRGQELAAPLLILRQNKWGLGTSPQRGPGAEPLAFLNQPKPAQAAITPTRVAGSGGLRRGRR
jgi:hypothetical protein